MHDKKKVDSVIKNIVVYRDGAYVTRTVKINLSQGRNKIIIEKLPCSIKIESIQVGVADGISCQQVNYEPNHNQYRIDTDNYSEIAEKYSHQSYSYQRSSCNHQLFLLTIPLIRQLSIF